MKRKLLLLLLAVCFLSACGSEEGERSPMEQAGAYLLEQGTPGYGSIGGEWLMLGMIRSGLELPAGYAEAYLTALEDAVTEAGGVLDQRKYTEYSRVVLTLTALGEDPGAFAGYDLAAPLSDTEQVLMQGVNGGIFALIALTPLAGYEDAKAAYLTYLLEAQLPDGGWALNGDAGQADLTAMALTALAPYEEGADAVEQGLAFLSAAQDEKGGFSGIDGACSESIAQVIIAMDALGIPMDDPAFLKDENSVYDALLAYQNEDGGFSHIMGDDTDQMATEQAFLALVAMNTEGSVY